MTIVDTTTGEVVERRPVLATPGSPITAQQIAEQCRSIEVWAEHCDSIDELREADARLSAIGEYLSRTTKDGRNAVATARLRLETRIGSLLGEAKPGRPTAETSTATELSKDQRSDFRKLNDHPEIVDAVIDESTDESPASRRKVLDEINKAKHADPPPLTDAEKAAKDRADAVHRAATRLRRVVDSFDQLVTLGSHPLRDEILEHLSDPDREAVLNLEKELFG